MTWPMKIRSICTGYATSPARPAKSHRQAMRITTLENAAWRSVRMTMTPSLSAFIATVISMETGVGFAAGPRPNVTPGKMTKFY